jgi:uncharacterized protein (DUF362 family)
MKTNDIPRKVAVSKIDKDLSNSVYRAMDEAGILSLVKSEKRIALKPNFTYPYYKQGITTSPDVIRETVKILRDYSSHVAIVETDGGYGAWRAAEAFQGHQMYDLSKEFGVEIVNLCEEPSEFISFRSGWRNHQIPLPVRLLHHTDVLITMPVPKIHCMTGLSLAYKNQWGCIPDIMRLRRHYVFDDAIIAVNQALKPVVLADGTFFLDRTGPMEGHPVRMNLIIAASDPGSFDRYVSELMGYSWRNVRHLKRAAKKGDLPRDLGEISFNIHPREISTRAFVMKRTLRHRVALLGFRSRFLTWLGYESWFGKVVLHSILYAIAGKPVKPRPETDSEIPKV